MKGITEMTEQEILALTEEDVNLNRGGEKLHSPSHSSPKGNELPRIS